MDNSKKMVAYLFQVDCSCDYAFMLDIMMCLLSILCYLQDSVCMHSALRFLKR